MKIQISKWLIVIATLVSLMFVVVGLEAKKGGGGKPPDSTDGVAAALNCVLVTDAGDTVRKDGLGPYEGGVDKVGCGHSGTLSTYGIQLNSVSKGTIKKAIRKIDLAFGECDGPSCQFVPAELLKQAQDDDVEDMENVWIGTGPYPGMDHISLLTPGKTYEMKSHIAPLGFADRFVIQLMHSEDFPPELGQGGWCNLEQNPDLVWEEDIRTDEDMTVCIWPDSNGDSLPDGYTITTGDFTDEDCLAIQPPTPPLVTGRFRTATICSTAGPYPCDGGMCNLLGKVPVQLTLHATYQ